MMRQAGIRARRITQLAVLGLLVLMPPPAFSRMAAGPDATPPVAVSGVEAGVEQIMVLTDVDAGLRFINFKIKNMLEEGREVLPLTSLPRIEDALATAFTPERFRRLLKQSVMVQADPALLPAVVAWCKTPLMRRITLANNQTVTPEGHKLMLAYRDNPQTAPLSARRLELLHKLDNVSEASTGEDAVLQDMLTAYMQALAFYPPDRSRQNWLAALFVSDRKLVAQRKEKVAARIAADRALVKQRTILGMAYVLRSLSDEEIEQYIGFFESPAGIHWRKVDNQAWRALWTDINQHHLALQMGQPIGKLDPP